ncbi:MAG: hypothetical protein A3G24_25125 [Betaproteobacteria bacterium RIFCSPLOWO2_12_FULL_62_13]|nr:MAG: hypothetical protein A3G24_25125 [Betaproteobacteria bacterium RIFCSPLOWO2_12_FULL_62_13]
MDCGLRRRDRRLRKRWRWRFKGDRSNRLGRKRLLCTFVASDLGCFCRGKCSELQLLPANFLLQISDKLFQRVNALLQVSRAQSPENRLHQNRDHEDDSDQCKDEFHLRSSRCW